MARPVETQIQQREVVNTDTNTARLNVAAEPVQFNYVAPQNDASKLAAALSDVKPQLMDWAINKQVEANKQTIQQGKDIANAGGDAPVEDLQKWGYESVKAVNDHTDFDTKIKMDYADNFNKDDGNINDFIASQQNSLGLDTKSDHYRNRFMPMVEKTFGVIRDAQNKYVLEANEAKKDTEIARMFTGDIEETTKNDVAYGITGYNARRESLQTTFPGRTLKQIDEIGFGAIEAIAMKTNNPKLLDVFNAPHPDGTPGLHEIPAWGRKIDAVVHTINARALEEIKYKDVLEAKAAKKVSDKVERDAAFSIAEAMQEQDPELRKAMLLKAQAVIHKASDEGVEVGLSTINAFTTVITKDDKEEGNLVQQSNYAHMMTSPVSTGLILKAITNHDITTTQFNNLMADNRRLQALSERGEKSVTVHPAYKAYLGVLKAHIGYQGAFGAINPTEIIEHKNILEMQGLEEINNLVESGGMTKEKAIAQVQAQQIVMIKSSGWESSNFQDNVKTLDNTKAKNQNPAVFYKSNPDIFVNDQKEGLLPKNITPTQLRIMQSDSEAYIAQQAAIKAKKNKNMKGVK